MRYDSKNSYHSLLLPPRNKHRKRLTFEMEALTNVAVLLRIDVAIFETTKQGRNCLFQLHESHIPSNAFEHVSV